MSELPSELRVASSHEWARLEEDGSVTIGITDHAQEALGDVVFVELPDVGDTLAAGGEAGVVESVKAASDIFSPMSGSIIEANEELNEDPGLINKSPYEKGWIYQVKPSNWVKETSSCLLAERATEWSQKEFVRFKDFLSGGAMRKFSSEPSMVLLQDGGEIRDNVLSELPDEVWADFQKEFLN